jgi:uncharacterized protein
MNNNINEIKKVFSMNKAFFVVFLLICIIPLATAQETGHITLLAVSEATQLGSTADLYLTTQSGRGGVYIETSPLTKLDTQLSTRFAQQIGCNFLDRICTDTDFFYTIRSDATIIGGPSAGAAIATVTVAMLEGLEINQSIAITGTINAGGLIGPVSGIIGKVDAAAKAGITKVLIPKGTRYELKPEHTYLETLENMSAPFYVMNNVTNTTEIDAVAYGIFMGIDVIEVATLEEAVFEITGQVYAADESEIVPETWYTTTMEGIATTLCDRNRDLVFEIDRLNWTNITIKKQIDEEIINVTRRAENATAYDMDYVAASTCFGSNIRLQYELFAEANMSISETTAILDELNITLDAIEAEIGKKDLTTITDLQTYLVVNGRLEEARDTVKEIKVALQMNNTNNAYNLAYAQERLYSAESWAQFFENDGKKLNLDQDALEDSCNRKLAEAQERYQYVKLATSEPLDKISSFMSLATVAADKENFIVCLDMASRAKANLDIIMSLVGIQREEELTELVEDRLRITRQVLNKQQEAGLFPMLGYSYYQYADFLKEKQPYSALIYSHYALEFSNLDMYFEEKQPTLMLVVDTENLLYFALGLGTGVVLCCLVSLRSKRVRKNALRKIQ